MFRQAASSWQRRGARATLIHFGHIFYFYSNNVIAHHSLGAQTSIILLRCSKRIKRRKIVKICHVARVRCTGAENTCEFAKIKINDLKLESCECVVRVQVFWAKFHSHSLTSLSFILHTYIRRAPNAHAFRERHANS